MDAHRQIARAIGAHHRDIAISPEVMKPLDEHSSSLADEQLAIVCHTLRGQGYAVEPDQVVPAHGGLETDVGDFLSRPVAHLAVVRHSRWNGNRLLFAARTMMARVRNLSEERHRERVLQLRLPFGNRAKLTGT